MATRSTPSRPSRRSRGSRQPGEPIAPDLRELFDCFGCSPRNKFGLQLQFSKQGAKVVAETQVATHMQGWAGMVHGGLLSTMIDELAVWTVIGQRRRFGVTRDLRVHFKRPMYVEQEIRLQGEVIEERGRLFRVSCELVDDRGQVCVDGEVSVFPLAEEQVRRMVPEGRLPESIKHYFG